MHPRVIGQREALATNRMLAASTVLVEALDLDPAILDALRTQRGDPRVRQMKQHEAVADLLEALVETQVKPAPQRQSKKKAKAQQDS